MVNTTRTTLTELVLAKAVDRLVLHYQFDEANILPFARFKSMANEPSNVASFPRWVEDEHEDIADETTSLTPAALETTAADITMGRVGIAREISSEALETTVLGRARLMSEIIEDAARLLGEAAEEDLLALFTAASNDVTDSGNDMTIADLVAGFGKQRAAKCRGPQVVALSDELLLQLQQAQAAATATPWATFYRPNADSTAFGGFFMSAPVIASGLTTTANTGANDVGCIFAQGQSAPRYAAFGYAVARNPTTKMDEDILEDTELMATTARYGVGTIAANFATKLVFDAP